eukprot:TRINITY_DN2104_c0_g1_i2.p1 TRINITY_DN2104_c0_g1~~TRINITY_DN2104_c0_g1_i2.p1  ORF type:complete len:1491 (+),score=355.43 TRINITY_DN2104_c0_g1_i2:89-4474(+)
MSNAGLNAQVAEQAVQALEREAGRASKRQAKVIAALKQDKIDARKAALARPESPQSEAQEAEDGEDSGSSHEDSCAVCGDGGDVLCCDSCPLVYHLTCVRPQLRAPPKGNWLCPRCKSEQSCPVCESNADPLEFCMTCKRFIHTACVPGTVKVAGYPFECGDCVVIEPDKAIDRILYVRFVPKPTGSKTAVPIDKRHAAPVDSLSAPASIDDRKRPRQFYVKWKGRSFVHAEWIPEERANAMNPTIVRGFWAKWEPEDMAVKEAEEGLVCGIRPEWLIVHRVVACRRVKSSLEYLVKWKELPYEDCTWETGAVVSAAEIRKFHDFDRVVDLSSLAFPNHPKRLSPPPFVPFTQQPEWLSAGTLYPYQLEGLNWLRFSWLQRTNVMLGDEMGLGKTLQAISFLMSLSQEHGIVGPFLVVAPLSTLPNWEREIAFWAPTFNVVNYSGLEKSRDVLREYEMFYHPFNQPRKANGETFSRSAGRKSPIKFNVLVTSYDIAIRDIDVLRAIRWAALVVDEAHRLKSGDSKLYSLLSEIVMGYRLLLTGTPLQNNLSELFQLLSFLQPDHDVEALQQRFSSLDETETVSQLHKLLAPHLLRRLKSDVLKSLPSKQELIIPVGMSPLQIQYYKAFLTSNFEVLRHQRSMSKMMNVLMQLRKCCNHPYVFPGAEPTTSTPSETLRVMIESSGKLALLDRMLEKLKERGHRVLIFSLMTRMLDILEDYCELKGFLYERLDGEIDTNVRQQSIDRFNKADSNRFIFLISTRAGGQGINLATADTVIIYDSDWNPHNDIQALSRAHRIGQQKKVMIYRLISKNSVEEVVIQRAKQKLVLEHLVVRKMNTKEKMDTHELDEILRFGAAEVFKEGNTTSVEYDDDALLALLDRNQQAKEAEEDQEQPKDTYLSTFKVASFGQEKTAERQEGDPLPQWIPKSKNKSWSKALDQAAAARGEAFAMDDDDVAEDVKPEPDAQIEAPPSPTGAPAAAAAAAAAAPMADDDPSFWETLLGEEHRQLLLQEQAALGRGKRSRKQREFWTTGATGAYPLSTSGGDTTTNGTSTYKLTSESSTLDSPSEGAHSSKQEAAAPPPRKDAPKLEVTGGLTYVYGFSRADREEFYLFFMRYGIQSVDEFVTKIRKFKHRFASKDPQSIRLYTSEFLKHISEPGDDPITFPDGVPKDSIKPAEALKRLGVLNMIHKKLENTLQTQQFTILDPRTVAPLVAQSSLHVAWALAEAQLAANPAQRRWTSACDLELLVAVSRHGHSNWKKILEDLDFHISEMVAFELGIEDGTDATRRIRAWLLRRLKMLEDALQMEAFLQTEKGKQIIQEQEQELRRQHERNQQLLVARAQQQQQLHQMFVARQQQQQQQQQQLQQQKQQQQQQQKQPPQQQQQQQKPKQQQQRLAVRPLPSAANPQLSVPQIPFRVIGAVGPRGAKRPTSLVEVGRRVPTPPKPQEEARQILELSDSEK